MITVISIIDLLKNVEISRNITKVIHKRSIIRYIKKDV